MASILKRKRGLVEVLDTPKRSKSAKNKTEQLVQNLGEKAGWEAAFNLPAEKKELLKVNDVNGVNGDHEMKEDSEEPVEFETYVDEDWQAGQEHKRQREAAEKALKLAIKKKAAQTWKLSEPIAGRMINVDPVFTVDEKFLIVATRTTVHIYSATTSLLTRSIKLKFNEATQDTSRIITFCLSPTDPCILWVACSDGSIFSIDWTTGAGADQYWGISSTGCIHMTVASMESAGRRRDVVFTTEPRKEKGWRITANELASPGGPIKTEARTIYTSTHQIGFLKTADQGGVIVGASGNRIIVGKLRSTEYDTIDKIRYEFRVFESADPISSLDVRVTKRSKTEGLKKSIKKLPVVDLVVGDVRGAVFSHNDLLAKLVISQEGSLPSGFSIMPRKMHWHRQAVCTVKWSLDGNYIISGGAETVLVLWQIDTGKQQYLPHMSATIQNVVVSPSGASYAVQLADNSAMILSTAELQPTANIAGIQTSIIEQGVPIESSVRRLEEESWDQPLLQRTPAVVNPADPSRLLLGVGQQQQIRRSNPLVISNPFLQTFDLGTGHNLKRQALTRTNITNVNSAPDSHRLSEPRVVHMKISCDGNWLATVDEWTPPQKDVDFLGHQQKNSKIEREYRREVFLKFWQWNKETISWELVSRIDSPHVMINNPGSAGRVFDLAVDPSSSRFATIGEDNIVRTWSTKTRKRDGVVVRGKDGNALRNWSCEHAISIGKFELAEVSTSETPTSGSVAFSEDGSLLAAASGCDDGVVYLMDTESGTIRLSNTGMFDGEIFRMDFLGQDLIIVSDKLNVYDLVSEELRFGANLLDAKSASTIQKQEMLHLAVDRKSRTFAVAVPRFNTRKSDKVSKYQSIDLIFPFSELVIFEKDHQEPRHIEELSSLVTALVATEGSEGYLFVDSAAEIRNVSRKGTHAITTMAQSTSALGLDAPEALEAPAGDLMRLVDEEVEEDVPESPAVAKQEEDDDENDTPVVSQQQLSQIFDIGPAYALPPLEEMFYQVAGLFSSKPFAQSVA